MDENSVYRSLALITGRYTNRCAVMRAINWRLFTISMLACGGASFGIVIFAVLINGWIAAVEDH